MKVAKDTYPSYCYSPFPSGANELVHRRICTQCCPWRRQPVGVITKVGKEALTILLTLEVNKMRERQHVDSCNAETMVSRKVLERDVLRVDYITHMPSKGILGDEIAREYIPFSTCVRLFSPLTKHFGATSSEDLQEWTHTTEFG